ncbi:MAG: pilin [Patescibacteria group bacterium]|nr:pilin [Patescibacteria group bacterium]
MLKFDKKIILAIILISFLVIPSICSAVIDLNLKYPTLGPEDNKFDLNENQDINEIVAWLYYFIISVSGFAAFAMLVRGGFMWLSSAGNPSVLGEAKDIISSAIFGLIIILTSFLILQVINPELTTLSIESLRDI